MSVEGEEEMKTQTKQNKIQNHIHTRGITTIAKPTKESF